MVRLFEKEGRAVAGSDGRALGTELYREMRQLWEDKGERRYGREKRLSGVMDLEGGGCVGVVLELANCGKPRVGPLFLWVDGERSGEVGRSVRGKGTTRFKVGEVAGAPHGLGLRVDHDGSGAVIIWKRKLTETSKKSKKSKKREKRWMVPWVEVGESTEVFWSVVAEVLANWGQVQSILE